MKHVIQAGFLLTVLLFSCLYTVSAQPVWELKSLRGNADNQKAQLFTRKNELTEVKYTPMGDPISKVTQIWFEVYNNGSQPTTVSIVDRIDSINASTLSVLYGTPKPDEVENFGNLTLILWENVWINTSSSVKYQYLAESLKEIPVIPNATLLVNGEQAIIQQEGELYIVNASVSDTITFEITVKNMIKKLYTDRGAITPPIMCVITATLSSEYFSGLKTSPETNSTSVVAGKSIMTWLVFLDESPKTFTISGKVMKTGPWGDIPVDPISIQITPASTTLKQQLEKSIDGLDASITMLESFTEDSYKLSDAIYMMAEIAEDIANATSQTGEVDAGLVNTLNLIAQGIYAHCVLLNQSSGFLQTAITYINLFMSDNQTKTFLLTNPDLARYLNYAVTNMTAAAALIDKMRNGDPSQNLPGLYQLYNSTLQIVQALNSTTLSLDEIVQSLHRLAVGLHLISNVTREAGDEMKAPLEDMREEKMRLEDLMLICHFKGMAPYDIEVRSHKYQRDYDIHVGVEPVNEALWAITNVDVTNPKNFTQIVYGVVIQLKIGQTPLQPSHVEVYINETWQTFNRTDVTQLGLICDVTTGALYLRPRLKLNAAVTENVLVDWLNRPVRIFVKGENEPEVEVEIDVGVLPNEVYAEPAKGQDVYSVTQPHLLVQKIPWGEPPPPSPPPPKSWIQILMENLQRPEIQLLVITLAAVTISLTGGFFLKGKRERRKIAEKGIIAAAAEKITTADLLREIDQMEKALRREEGADS